MLVLTESGPSLNIHGLYKNNDNVSIGGNGVCIIIFNFEENDGNRSHD